jgi:hypothetical protein
MLLELYQSTISGFVIDVDSGMHPPEILSGTYLRLRSRVYHSGVMSGSCWSGYRCAISGPSTWLRHFARKIAGILVIEITHSAEIATVDKVLAHERGPILHCHCNQT